MTTLAESAGAARTRDRVAWWARPATRLWAVPLVIYALTRLLDAGLFAWLGGSQYAQVVDGGHMVNEPIEASPGYLTLLTNWDGQWYQQVAEQGYPTELPRVDGEVQQNAWAFYPLFPGLVRAVMTLSHLPFALAATLVSTLAGAAAMVLLYRMVARVGGHFNATTTVLALCLYATAPVLQAAYTESLALLLLVLALWSLGKRRYGLVAVSGLLLALTRPIVLPLALVIAVHALLRWRARHEDEFPVRERWACLGACAITGLSFAIWPVIPGIVTGEPDAYFETYGAWVRDNDKAWHSWLGQLSSMSTLPIAFFGLGALALLVYIVTRRRAAAWGTELRLWSVAYGLYLVGTTVPGPSVLRHMMFAIIPFWPAPHPIDRPLTRTQQVLVLATIVLIGVATQYFWISRFWVIGPGATSLP
jgi:hypothetical protein